MAGLELTRLNELRRSAGQWVLTTHVNPDADGVGSQLAFASWLRSAGASVRIINRDPLPRLLDFLDSAGEVDTYEPERHDRWIAAADVVVMLDNSVPSRLGQMLEPVSANGGVKACIDHHPDPDPFWQLLAVDPTACCTAEIVFDLFRISDEPVDPSTANALYTALIADTGRFRFANTSERAFRMAADLVARGADPAFVCSHLEERLSGPFVKMMGSMLAGIEQRAEGRLLLLRTPDELATSDALHGEDLAEVINFALRVGSSRIAALFRQLGPGRTKVSLRSKGDLDVNRLARAHGGGGHKNASGLVLDRSPEEAIALLVAELEQLARS
ncbi:MAG: bifunctional oligoribonuclease/PAP phosphatase NrnA [Acidobacteriota bacterium]|nr:MAG: bifunctional oligoribonuclease/PAP phosphatase NrnA [Acidobacteriota bacterium]